MVTKSYTDCILYETDKKFFVNTKQRFLLTKTKNTVVYKHLLFHLKPVTLSQQYFFRIDVYIYLSYYNKTYNVLKTTLFVSL